MGKKSRKDNKGRPKKESIDGETLAVLYFMSRDMVEGVSYKAFNNMHILNGALDLVDEGYATRVENGQEDVRYCLTRKGIHYLDSILEYAQRIKKTV